MPSINLTRAALVIVVAAAVLSPLAIASAGEGVAGVIARCAEYFFGTICHQLPERSLWFNGQPLAVCARCWSLWMSGALGLVLGLYHLVPRPERFLAVLVVATAPMLVDVALNLSGFGGAGNVLRMLISAPTGLVAGAIAGFGIDEILHKQTLHKQTLHKQTLEDACPNPT